MDKLNFKAIGISCAAVVVLVIARLGVSLGRLIYSIQTGVNVVGGDVLPTWWELVFEDGFFYVGVLALLGCILCAILERKKA